MDMPRMVQYTSRSQVPLDSASVMPRHHSVPSTQVNGAQGTRNGRYASGRGYRNTSTMPMEIRSASKSNGKMAAISAANTPVITVDTCGVLKRGWQRLMNGGSSPSSAIDRRIRGCPRSEVRMTEVMPAMTPTLRIHDSQESCGGAGGA